MELGIMEYIHETCQKIGVKYFLAYGSLIGAVRHKGFIPWMMTWISVCYEKIMKVARLSYC